MTERLGAAPDDRPDPPAERRARIRTFATIPELLDFLGVAVEPLLRAVDLDAGSFREPRGTITLEQFDALLGACARRARCAHFGLLAGAHVRLEHLGEAGRLAATGSTVAQALHDLLLSSDLQSAFGAPALAVHGTSAVLSYGFHAPRLENADLAYDFVTAAIASVMRELCGEDWRPTAVHLPRARPRNLEPYRSVFGAPLRFHALQAGLVVQGATLSRRVVTADPATRRRLLGRAHSELQLEPAIVRDVRRAIRLLLERGTCSRSLVAARLAMHERALGRRLLRAETTFQALLDETRATVAQELLRGTDETVERIARTVGYRDSTVLGRAFRRWTGMTPRQYRASHRTPSGGQGWGDGARN